MRVFLIGGAGTIGSATAAYLSSRSLVDEVVLYDQNSGFAQSHAMDLNQANFCISKTRVTAGGWSDLARCEIVIVAAGLPASIATRDYCKDMCSLMPMIREISENLNRYQPSAVVLSMTNPLDAFNYMLYHTAGLPARQFIALSQNDSLRFRWALGEYLNADPARIEAYVAGEHGPGKFPLFSTATLDGAPISLDEAARKTVLQEMDRWWKHFLEVSGPRTAGWTSGAAAGQIVEAIQGRWTGPICCSCIAEENQGYSMGYPAFLNTQGLVRLPELTLTAEEQATIARCRAALQESQQQILAYINQHA